MLLCLKINLKRNNIETEVSVIHSVLPGLYLLQANMQTSLLKILETLKKTRERSGCDLSKAGLVEKINLDRIAICSTQQLQPQPAKSRDNYTYQFIGLETPNGNEPANDSIVLNR
jgi:hypothetical protein